MSTKMIPNGAGPATFFKFLETPLLTGAYILYILCMYDMYS